MIWALAAAALGAGAGIYGANRAADATKDASKEALALQHQQWLASLGMLEPQRALGYGAQSDLASLYGYALPAYQPLNALTGGGTTAPGQYVGQFGGGPGTLERMVGGTLAGPFGGLLGGGHNPYSSTGALITVDGSSRTYGGTINLATGEVTVNVPGQGYKDEALSKQATEALRAGRIPGDGAWSRFSEAMSRAQAAGYRFDPKAIEQAQQQQAGPTGQPGNMSRFFASPDYQFRQQEGAKSIDRSAAARGGALSGNAARAQTEYASNLASQEFGNYTSRLMQIAGLGSAATNNAVNVGQSYAANAGNLIQQQGDARASGIMGAANSVVNGINNGMSLWAWQRGMQQPQAGRTPPYSPYGPYSGGRMP